MSYKSRYSQHVTQAEKNSAMNTNSSSGRVPTQRVLAHQNHDYHIIDEFGDVMIANRGAANGTHQSFVHYLLSAASNQHHRGQSPSNSVESFEFINVNSSQQQQQQQLNDVKKESNVDQRNVASYEKSWENPTLILLNSLKGALFIFLCFFLFICRKRDVNFKNIYGVKFNVNNNICQKNNFYISNYCENK
jgi:hypothetical protein